MLRMSQRAALAVFAAVDAFAAVFAIAARLRADSSLTRLTGFRNAGAFGRLQNRPKKLLPSDFAFADLAAGCRGPTVRFTSPRIGCASTAGNSGVVSYDTEWPE